MNSPGAKCAYSSTCMISTAISAGCLRPLELSMIRVLLCLFFTLPSQSLPYDLPELRRCEWFVGGLPCFAIAAAHAQSHEPVPVPIPVPVCRPQTADCSISTSKVPARNGARSLQPKKPKCRTTFPKRALASESELFIIYSVFIFCDYFRTALNRNPRFEPVRLA